MHCSKFLLAGFLASSLPWANQAQAQEAPGAYPSRPVLVVAPIAGGGPLDTETRVHARKMSEFMGQQFVVENKPGAGGIVGGGFVAKAAADGYTILSISTAFTVYPSFYNLPFDLIKDFSPISQVSKRTTVLVANPSFPVQTFAEYVAYAKSNPGKVNFGTTGAGSATHLAGAWMHSATNTRVTFVHYKGTGPLMPDILAGRISVTPAGLLVALPLIKSGKLRVLAIMNDRRAAALPNVPTIAEQGITDYDYANWLGFIAPAGTPASIINKLSDSFAKVAKSPDIAATLESDGGIMVGNTPSQFRQILVQDMARWRKLIQESGIKLED